MSRNQLDQESSPYLLLHKDNPVHWRPWGPEALAEAEATGKPIMLSIGYTACHWCHVMNKESFADPDMAAVLNDNFINIKVDREERPDIDQIYQTAASVSGGQGGWPLTAFLTPKGEAFIIGTYFPPENTADKLSFRNVVNEVISVYRDRPDDVTKVTESINAQLSNLWHRDFRAPITLNVLDQAALRVAHRFDIFNGGITGAPKFPNMAQVEMLFRAYLRTGKFQFELLVQATLHNISLGGIYDHVGGGIHRYAVDEQWFQPHFEKMLYDNAQYIDMLTLAWQQTRDPLYRIRIEETANWVLREMMVGEGFAASLDADSEGVEGKYYLWSEAELQDVLAGTFLPKFKSVYNITPEGNFEGSNILYRLGPNSIFPQSDADETLLAKQRGLLLQARQNRVPPRRDDKVLADWNGMMITALSNAGVVFRKSNWIVAAVRAFDFIEKTLCDGDRIYHSWANGKRGKVGFSDDYAHMIKAALSLWEGTNDPRYLKRAQDWVRTMNEHYWDAQNGGYFSTADDADPLFTRPRPAFDQSQPSANGLMPGLLSKLFLATMDSSYRQRVNAQIESFATEVGRNYIGMPTFMNSFETVLAALQIVIVGSISNPKTHELVSAVTGRALPQRMVMMVDPDQALPEGHPAHGKTMVDGQPTAYICHAMTCEPPITNPVTLSQALRLPDPATQPRVQSIGQPQGSA